MKEAIAITGSEGNIGTVLKNGLSDKYDITPIDIKIGIDIRDYSKLLQAIQGSEVLIHLAWLPKNENWKLPTIDPDNAEMYRNVYKAAIEAGVKRVVMASTIHTDDFYNWHGEGLMSPYQEPHPHSGYGQDKIEMEKLGREYAAKGLQVVCIRFGGVNPANKAPIQSTPRDMATWFSHNDCVNLIDSIIKASDVPNNFVIVYGVSNNTGRISDVSNPFNWVPKERAEDFK